MDDHGIQRLIYHTLVQFQFAINVQLYHGTGAVIHKRATTQTCNNSAVYYTDGRVLSNQLSQTQTRESNYLDDIVLDGKHVWKEHNANKTNPSYEDYVSKTIQSECIQSCG